MKVVFIRHGRSMANDTGVCAGWYDTPLCEKGIEELRQHRETYTYPKTDRYYSSDLSRAYDTFKILYGEETPLAEKTSAFREMSVGDYENVAWDAMDFNPFDELFGNNKPVLNGETVSQMSLRVFGKLTKILSEMDASNEDSVTIVCHAGVIMMVLTFLAPLSFEERMNIETPNGLGYVMDLDFDAMHNHIRLNSYHKVWE